VEGVEGGGVAVGGKAAGRVTDAGYELQDWELRAKLDGSSHRVWPAVPDLAVRAAHPLRASPASHAAWCEASTLPFGLFARHRNPRSTHALPPIRRAMQPLLHARRQRPHAPGPAFSPT